MFCCISTSLGAARMHPGLRLFSRVFVTTVIFVLGPLVRGSTLPRALNKANEYPKLNLAEDGSNNPSWHHTPGLCSCVPLDTSDASAYLPGKNGKEGLGEIGGGCVPLDTQFAAGRIGSVYWYTPIVGDAIKGEFQAFIGDAKKMLLGAIKL
ncbi:hypothetical protein B0J14DRAFT_620027 [Halenospora varia]|nr:hypothetical protein B0J14DRAFT_620027 [Halenospora varia]